MKLSIPDIKLDERGVSPVIGVILMVAITVILAAVIGAFVLNLGNQVGNVPPQASIAAEDAGDDFNASNAFTAFYINHQTGDDVKFSDLRIVIQNESGANIAEFSSGSWTDDNLTITGTGGTTFEPGDQLVVEAGSGHALEDDTTYTFIFIDTASGQSITRSEATLQ